MPTPSTFAALRLLTVRLNHLRAKLDRRTATSDIVSILSLHNADIKRSLFTKTLEEETPKGAARQDVRETIRQQCGQLKLNFILKTVAQLESKVSAVQKVPLNFSEYENRS